MGEARRRHVNGNRLLVPDKTLVAPNGAPLSGANAAAAAQAKHYGLVLLENGVIKSQQGLADPFIRVQIQLRGWKKAWRVLRGTLTLEVQVHGDNQAMRDVFGPNGMIRP